MDDLSRYEIYIPKDAEVKRIPLQSLPRSLLTGMGLSSSDSDDARKLRDSPEGIWICPAVLQHKGQKPAPDTGNSLSENMSSKLAKEFRTPPEPIQMCFNTSNRAARKLLYNTVHGVNFSADTSSTSDLPLGTARQTYKIAVVIYQGRIYLSIRRASRSQRQRETCDAPTASGPATPSTSGTSSSSQRKRMAPDAVPKPASKKTQKIRLRIPPPPGSMKLKNPTKKTNAVNQEMLNGSKPERSQIKSKETQRGNNTTSQTTPFAPQQANRVGDQSQSHMLNGVSAEQTPEDAAGRRSPGLSTAGGEAANTSQNNVHINSHMESRDQSREESQPSALQQQPCDFKELEQDEKIAQIKARIKKQKAALNNPTN